MIAPLRRRHRWLAPTSFAAALVGVLAGVMVRPDAFVDAGSGRDSVLAAPAYVAQAARPVPGIDGLGAALVPGEGDRMDLWLMAEASPKWRSSRKLASQEGIVPDTELSPIVS